MKRRHKPFKKINLRYRFAAVVVVILMLLSMLALDRHVIPLMVQYGRTQAQWYITRVLNEAVTAVLADEQPQYEQLITLSRDAEGNVTAAQADVHALNRIKAALSLEMTERIGDKGKLTVSIPLGTFLGSRLFSGRGPLIHIPVSISCGLLSDFDASFSEAGINQTSHRIILDVEARVFLAIPTAKTSVDVHSTFIIAESILLGKVPDAYTVVENIDEETVGEIFDYGAQLQN